jgi:cytoskeletal protein RodZ
MELFIFFLIAALGGFWWVNSVMKKRAEDLRQNEVKKDEPESPYKVEAPVVPDLPVTPVQAEPAVVKPVEVEPAVVTPVEVEPTPVVAKTKPATEKKPAARRKPAQPKVKADKTKPETKKGQGRKNKSQS